MTLAERSKMLKEERRDKTAVMGNCKDSINIIDGAWNLAYDVSSRVNRNKRNVAYVRPSQLTEQVRQNVFVLVAAGCAAASAPYNRSCSQSLQLAKEWDLGADDCMLAAGLKLDNTYGVRTQDRFELVRGVK